MILDKEAQFEWQNSITVTRVSTNTYDLGVALRDVAINAGDLWLVGVVYAPFVRAAGAMTVACDLVGDDNASLSSPTTLFNLMAATSKATLVAGYQMFRTRLPVGVMTERYLGLNWTCSAAGDSGSVSVILTPNIDAQIYYPRGYVNY